MMNNPISSEEDINRYKELFNKEKNSEEQKEIYALEAKLFDEGHFTGINYNAPQKYKFIGQRYSRITNPFMN